MIRHHSWIVALAIVAALGGTACKSQKSAEEQKKIDDLQAQLDDAKKQLEAKEQAAKAAETPAPAAQPAPAAAAQPARATGGAAPKAGAAKAAPAPGAKSPEYVTTEQAQKAKEQYAQDKTKVKQAFEQQEQTNQQVQQQIQEMKPREFTLPAGTVIPVRTTTELSTSKLANGSVFDAVLEKALVMDDTVLAPQGAHVTGVVVSSDSGGRVKGVASLAVTIRSISGVRDTTIKVKTNSVSADAGTTKGRDAKRTGLMTGAGAVIGAIAGGGKGAAIGAGAGAAAGVGTNMATKGKAAVIPAESLLEFTLAAPTTVVLRH